MTDIPKESPRTILFQFVIFPLGIVVIGVAIFLLFGQLASNEASIPSYLSDIRSGSDHRKFQAAYELSKSIKRGEASQYPNLGPELVNVYRGAANDDPRIRQYLTLVMGKIGDRRVTPVLIESLKEPLVETRIYALAALAELRDPQSVPAIIEATRDEEKDVRKTAYFTLGVIGDERAVPVLAAALEDRSPTSDSTPRWRSPDTVMSAPRRCCWRCSTARGSIASPACVPTRKTMRSPPPSAPTQS